MEGMKNWIGTAVAGLNSKATRTVRGAISFNSSTHLPPTAGSLTVKPVMLPPGCARFAAKPLPIGSVTREHDGNCARLVGKRADRGCAHTEDRVGPQIDQLFCERSVLIRISGAPAKFDPEIAAFRPPQLRERSPECCEPRLHAESLST